MIDYHELAISWLDDSITALMEHNSETHARDLEKGWSIETTEVPGFDHTKLVEAFDNLKFGRSMDTEENRPMPYSGKLLIKSE